MAQTGLLLLNYLTYPLPRLDDHVVNQYLALMMTHFKSSSSFSFKILDTYFYSTLVLENGVYSFDRVKKQTKEGRPLFGLLDLEEIFIPIHVSNTHWVLIIISLKDCEIIGLDSLHTTHRKISDNIKKFVSDLFIHERQEEIDIDSWRVRWRKNIPKQLDGHNCGVWVCFYIMHILSSGKNVVFPKELNVAGDGFSFRERMFIDICKGRFLSSVNN